MAILSIFEYMDYRLFMADYLKCRKSENAAWSYRFLASRLAMDAGHLVKIMQGKLHLPSDVVPVFCQLVQFNSREQQYFDHLIEFTRARGAKATQISFEKLMIFRGVDMKNLEEGQQEYYSKWYHSAIRSLLAIWPYRGNIHELAGLLAPSIKPTEAEESIALLQSLGMVRCNADGMYALTDIHVTPSPRINKQVIRQYQRETLEMAARALETFPPDFREISTVTVSIRKSDMESLRELLLEVRRQFQYHAQETDDPDSIWQLNMQFYPLALLPHLRET